MKTATTIGISASTSFYMLCGLLGYAAFGNNAPGNYLTGFGFYEPFWLVDIANLCIVIHLLGAYQVLNLFTTFLSHSRFKVDIFFKWTNFVGVRLYRFGRRAALCCRFNYSALGCILFFYIQPPLNLWHFVGSNSTIFCVRGEFKS